MASINKAKTLVKRVALADLSSKDGLSMTIMLNGPHGIGKTQIVKAAAKEMGGICITIDGSVLKEGDATGIPFPFKLDDGTQEVRFIKHNGINKIWRLEKYYYEKACTTGLLNGSLKIENDAEGNEYLIRDGKKTLVRTALDKIEEGEDNKYKISGLTPDEMLKLFENGDVKPVLLFIDELNRAEMQTMKELMNIILNHNVNGYVLPWWVTIIGAINPSSQNSSYATTELDPAQYSRFINLKVSAKLEDWVQYGLANGMNTDVIDAIAVSENIFNQKDSSTEDTTEMGPDPRAWEMVAHLLDTAEEVNNTKYFTPEERKEVDEDIRTLVYGKVGNTAGRTFFMNINNKENNIKPEEILTLKEKTLNPTVIERFSRQKDLSKVILSYNLVTYLENRVDEIIRWKRSSSQEEKVKYMNLIEQLKAFVKLMSPANQSLFASRVIKSEKNGKRVLNTIGVAFSAEILTTLQNSEATINDLQKDN